jgi:2-polyprenyl-3-methyl-5-hydroxy-6-metoxy-1,4-benzoquinol methylase
MIEMPWTEQIAYYRARAAEYDLTAYGDPTAAQRRIAALVQALNPTGNVLEIACGTGLWTDQIRRYAQSVTAVDAAPEMIEQARGRMPGTNIDFVVADVFDWVPPRRFDTVFFAFWLSHVPEEAFERFWSAVGGMLVDDGRAIFVDEQLSGAVHESYLAGSTEIVERRLTDGSAHRIVKVFRGPTDLAARLADAGWHARVEPVGDDWLIGDARQAGNR